MPHSPAFETLDEIHCETRHGDKRLLRRQLSKRVLTCRGGWATILFVWQDWRTGKPFPGWREPRFVLERWRRVAERWHRTGRVAMRADEVTTALAIAQGMDVEDLIDIADMRDDHEKTPPGGQEPGGVAMPMSAEAETS